MKGLLPRCLLACVLVTGAAEATVQRFAVIVGNNHGRDSDPSLRYAESDASKVARVLRDLGGFPPANIVLLKHESGPTFRSTLIAVNDRIRGAKALPNSQALLFVYYSGHADAHTLHLGKTSLALSELSQLVRGSSATFRLLVVDACRSGALTRVKGGSIVAPFALPPEPSLRGEGMAFLTASSANEDAQESDAIGGSFFTHALVSGLLGAADTDGDGKVVLEEAYRHAYDATLRATSRTFAGTQHPTFQYDFRGQDALVLTRLDRAQKQRASLGFPDGITFLVLRGNAQGPVIAEVGEKDPARSLSLRPGSYFVRGRGKDVLLEGTLSISAGQSYAVDPDQLERVEYARLVRKGERTSALSHGPELGVEARTRLPNAETPCLGVVAGYRLEFEQLSFFSRLGACRSGFDNAVVDATTDELHISIAALRAFDLPFASLALGLGGGMTVTNQRFDTLGDAPDRRSAAPFVAAKANATFHLVSAVFLGLDLDAETHFIRLQTSANQDPEQRTAFALRSALLSGLQF